MSMIPKLARVALFCMAATWWVPSWPMDANCNGEITADQELQMELCSAHPGCRLVMSIAKNCQSVKKLLNRLPAGKDPIDDAKMDKIFEGASGKSVCWRNFNYQSCKSYLFGYEAVINSGQSDEPDPPLGARQTVRTVTQRMSKSAAIELRKSILNEDDGLYNRLDLDCRSAFYSGCQTVFALLDHLQLRVKHINEDSEYLAQLPPIELQAPQKAERKGWRKTDKGWVNLEADRIMSACERDKREVSDLVDERKPGARDRVEGFKRACASIHDQYDGLTRLWMSKLGKPSTGNVVGEATVFEQGVQAQLRRADQVSGRTEAELLADWQLQQEQLAANARASEQARLSAAKREASAQELARIEKQRDAARWGAMTNALVGAAQVYADAKESQRQQREAQRRLELETQQRAEREARNSASSGQTLYAANTPKPVITISSPGQATVSSETNPNESKFDGERAKRLVGTPGGGIPKSQPTMPSNDTKNVLTSQQRNQTEKNRAQPAMQCVKIVRMDPFMGWDRKAVNVCTIRISIGWCTVGVDCRHQSWGYTNGADLAPQREATLSAPGSTKGRVINLGACEGRYTVVEDVDENSFKCGEYSD